MLGNLLFHQQAHRGTTALHSMTKTSEYTEAELICERNVNTFVEYSCKWWKIILQNCFYL